MSVSHRGGHCSKVSSSAQNLLKLFDELLNALLSYFFLLPKHSFTSTSLAGPPPCVYLLKRAILTEIDAFKQKNTFLFMLDSQPQPCPRLFVEVVSPSACNSYSSTAQGMFNHKSLRDAPADDTKATFITITEPTVSETIPNCWTERHLGRQMVLLDAELTVFLLNLA